MKGCGFMLKNEKNDTTRRKILKKSLLVVPTIVTFAVTDLKAHASLSSKTWDKPPKPKVKKHHKP